jgi:hypothetical protein
MTEKTIKVLGILLLFTIGMAGAFRLLAPPSAVKPPTLVGNVKPSPDSAVPADQLSSASFDRQGFHSQGTPVAVPPPVAALPENGDSILNSTTNEDEILNKLRAWARRDPETALIWGQQQTNNADACFQIAQADPGRAVKLAEQLNLNKDTVSQNLAQQWAGQDLTTAYNWISAQPAGDRRDALATGLTFVWSQSEPLNAAQFVVQQMSPGPAQDEAIMMVLHQWALTDFAGASAWAQQFPDNPLRIRALNELQGIATYKQALAQSK